MLRLKPKLLPASDLRRVLLAGDVGWQKVLEREVKCFKNYYRYLLSLD